MKDVIDIDKIRRDRTRIDEIPFDSERKMMSTINIYNKEADHTYFKYLFICVE